MIQRRVRVEDAAGTVVETVPFVDALEIKSAGRREWPGNKGV